ncbi:mitochondrial import inner membrane translocase subunit TIM23 [Pseudoscourfieldia marina]
MGWFGSSSSSSSSASSVGVSSAGEHTESSLQGGAQSSSASATDYGAATLGEASGGAMMGAGGGGARMHNPYEGLHGTIDPALLKNVYTLPKAPEQLFTEQAVVNRRSWSENLTYYCGTGYLIGGAAGGAVGAREALTTPAPKGVADTSRLRANRLLNATGHYGRSAGNAAGVLGLYYALMESGALNSMDAYLHTESGSVAAVVAGAGAGALYKSAAGSRRMAVAASVGAVAAGTIHAIGRTVFG